MRARHHPPPTQATLESVTILRDLWGRRIFVAIVALVAITVGYSLSYRVGFPPERRSYTVGVATASVLVDTPRSQVVEVAPKGSDALAARANVLANLMVDGEVKNAIVARVGLDAKQVIASSSSPGNVDPPPTLTEQSRAYATSVALTSDMAELPIIRVQTQAPDVAQAIKLANAAVEGLGEYLDSRAADESVSESRRLRLRPLGTAQGHVAARGPSRMMGLAIAFVLFIVGCALILAVSALVRGWRAAAALDKEFDAFNAAADPLEEDEGFGPREWSEQPDETARLRAS